jgi:hypothetical protein
MIPRFHRVDLAAGFRGHVKTAPFSSVSRSQNGARKRGLKIAFRLARELDSSIAASKNKIFPVPS